jgi:hypothetical protein
MQKNEKSLGGGEEALAEGALGPGAAECTLDLFLLILIFWIILSLVDTLNKGNIIEHINTNFTMPL